MAKACIFKGEVGLFEGDGFLVCQNRSSSFEPWFGAEPVFKTLEARCLARA
jgi:hypothetical protein